MGATASSLSNNASSPAAAAANNMNGANALKSNESSAANRGNNGGNAPSVNGNGGPTPAASAVTRTEAVAEANPNVSPAQREQRSHKGYAYNCRSPMLGVLPPIAGSYSSKAMPDYVAGGRDCLQRAQEQFIYQRDVARFNRRCDAAPCATACEHKFSSCRRGCDGSFLHNADLFSDGRAPAANGCANSLYEDESGVLARQLEMARRGMRAGRYGSLDYQKATHGAEAVDARKPMAGAAVQEQASAAAAAQNNSGGNGGQMTSAANGVPIDV